MRLRALIGVMVLVQAVSAFLYLASIIITLVGRSPFPWIVHELVEIGAAVGLLIGTALSFVVLRRSLRRTQRAEAKLRAASGAFMELLEDRFGAWNLTPAERDVALFAIKGMSTPEIARLRGTSEGTVKAQTAAIYRKAGVTGRPQLLSVFIEDLMAGPVLPPDPPPDERAAAGQSAA